MKIIKILISYFIIIIAATAIVVSSTTITKKTTNITNNNNIKMNKDIKCSNFDFKWDLNNVIDHTRYSKEKGSGPSLCLSNENKTAKRIERIIGDDFPPVRIYSDKSINLNVNETSRVIQWSVHIDNSHGFVEIGIVSPSSCKDGSNLTYFIKGFKNEAQIENGVGKSSAIEFGEPLAKGDTITICLQINSGSGKSTMSMNILKNDNLLGAPFNDIPINGHSYYPMIGLNDGGDQISILNQGKPLN